MDYVPKQRTGLKEWLENMSDNVVAEAVKFGGVAGDATAAKALADGLLAKFALTDAAATALDGARNIERSTQATALAGLRAYVRNWKTLPGWAGSGSEAVLKVIGGADDFDPATYQPKIDASIDAGKIRINWKKKGADGIAVYCRLRGSAAWRRIGTDTEPPYFDTAPLAQAGVPEVREYMARGMVGDEEIGQDSDIISITFGG